MDTSILVATKVIPDASRIESFDGNNFKRWQHRILEVLDFSQISFVLQDPKPDQDSENFHQALKDWELADKLCKHNILRALSNDLYDICNTHL